MEASDTIASLIELSPRSKKRKSSFRRLPKTSNVKLDHKLKNRQFKKESTDKNHRKEQKKFRAAIKDVALKDEEEEEFVESLPIDMMDEDDLEQIKAMAQKASFLTRDLSSRKDEAVTGPALTPQEQLKLRTQKLTDRMLRIASLGSDILSEFHHQRKTDPYMAVMVRKLVMFSLMEVFKDIVLSYRIRPLTETEKASKVKKETQQLREFEKGLVSQYKFYPENLEQAVKAAGGPATLQLPQQTKKCLDVMLTKRRKRVNLQHALAFVKRLSTLSLHTLPNATVDILASNKMLIHTFPKCNILLDNEAQGSGVFLPELDEPEYCNPQNTALWELHTLRAPSRAV
ncbi:nucleolar complex protein 3 homolog [Oncorhynchus masou masou]|uniref:nucleolar complex protein 3 homolog n=1 Tax=Oncorhynchus masou masou TaxID=90313 RepID=UPI003182F0F1